MGEPKDIVTAIDGLQQHVDRRIDDLTKNMRADFERQRAQIAEVAIRLERVSACAEEAHEKSAETAANGKVLREKFETQRIECVKSFGQIRIGFWTDVRSIGLTIIAISGFTLAVLKLVL